MSGGTAHLSGELTPWPSKRRLAAILCGAGLRVSVGDYSIRVECATHFVFQEFGGDLGDPTIEAEADNAAALISEAALVSGALATAGVRHRFEIYDDQSDMVAYLHHAWPRQEP